MIKLIKFLKTYKWNRDKYGEYDVLLNITDGDFKQTGIRNAIKACNVSSTDSKINEK